LISFTDEQMRSILTAARSVPIESRDACLKLIAEQMRPRGIDLMDAIRRALNYIDVPDHAAD
jgi:hypothetical protein